MPDTGSAVCAGEAETVRLGRHIAIAVGGGLVIAVAGLAVARPAGPEQPPIAVSVAEVDTTSTATTSTVAASVARPDSATASPSPSGPGDGRGLEAAAETVALAAPPAAALPVPPGGTFWDDDGNVHESMIEAIAAAKITRGCTRDQADLYCPLRDVTRREMAAFLVRALHLPPSATDHFEDDNGSVFEANIDALAAAGITRGCGPDRFCPDRPVSRAEMAAFLVRAFGYEQNPAGDRFVDDDGSVFEAVIERLAAAGVTVGCNPPASDRYCPENPVRRDQMASFLARALELAPVAVPPRPSRTLTFTGDTLIHTPIASQAARNAGGSDDYDFRPMFGPIRSLIQDADLAICHLEVPLTGRSKGVSGYPRFSSPPEVADALVWAGYDGCSTASNHSVDQGFSGLTETIEVMKGAGLGQAGMSATEAASEQITTYDVSGVTVAHLSATYGLNGLPLPTPWAVELIDLDRLLDHAERARRQGADFVVVSVHCCVEYDHQPTSYQVEVHRTLVDSPYVDLVVGHHAHVVQPIGFRNGEYVVYGLGNILSNQQRPETIDGVVVGVEIAKRGSGWDARSVDFTPTWVERGTFRILPTAETLADGSPSAALARQLAASWRRTEAVITSLDAPAVSPTATP